jgi:hypothetical protein
VWPSWANRLQDRVDYLIVENAATPHADLSYWHKSEPAQRFREMFQPAVIAMEFRLADLENPARQHGVTLGQVAERKTQGGGTAESIHCDASAGVSPPVVRGI